MKLVIGGTSQGKKDYVLGKLQQRPVQVWDGELPEEKETEKTIVINHLHLWVRKRLEAQGEPECELETWLAVHPDSILISDEIGNGIVPMDAFERAYRERTGRILVNLAGKADTVERVFCGIGQKLK